MNRKFIDILFIWILISMPFHLVNHWLWIPGSISGPFTHDMVAWPLLLGVLYTAYCQWKYKNVLYGWKQFRKYIILYLAILFASLVYGLFVYPYWDMVFNGQAMGNAKFAFAVGLLAKMGLSAGEEQILPLWLGLRCSKDILLNVLYNVGGAYMIFCWYHDRAERAIQLLRNTTVGLLVAIAAYGVVDMCYQNGQWWAQNFISVMFPLMHTNPEGWHFGPFCGARNRSIFLEPSYYAIYMTFAFPILWWKMMESRGERQIALGLLYLLLACQIYLGQSRTGTALFWGELALLAMITLYYRRKKLFLLMGCLLVGAAISFGGAIYFLQNYQVPARYNDKTPLATRRQELSEKEIALGQKGTKAESYVNDSLLSLVDKEKAKKRAGSNHVRLGITFAEVGIGMNHPLLGVGTRMDTAYLYDVLKEDQNGEIKRDLIGPMEKKGVLNSGTPMMCEYASQFMQTGVLGLLFFLVPMGGAIFLMGRRLLRRIDDERELYLVLFVLLADIGISVTGLGNTVRITYAYWLMVGVSYVVELALRRREAMERSQRTE